MKLTSQRIEAIPVTPATGARGAIAQAWLSRSTSCRQHLAVAKILCLRPFRLDPKHTGPSPDLGSIDQIAANSQHLVNVAKVAFRFAHLMIPQLAQDDRLDGCHKHIVILDPPENFARECPGVQRIVAREIDIGPHRRLLVPYVSVSVTRTRALF